MEYGFFYLIIHGVEEDLLHEVLEGNRNFFTLPLEEKMKLALKKNRGYSPVYAENLDPSSSFKGFSSTESSDMILPAFNNLLVDSYEMVTS